MDVDEDRVFDVFLYLIRSGSVLCALDAVDEAVSETSLAGQVLDLSQPWQLAVGVAAAFATSAILLTTRFGRLVLRSLRAPEPTGTKTDENPTARSAKRARRCPARGWLVRRLREAVGPRVLRTRVSGASCGTA